MLSVCESPNDLHNKVRFVLGRFYTRCLRTCVRICVKFHVEHEMWGRRGKKKKKAKIPFRSRQKLHILEFKKSGFRKNISVAKEQREVFVSWCERLELEK